MDAGRWNQVEDCYHAALERPPDQRARFLAQACAHDPELRREVESLLGHEGEADGLPETPAWDHLTPPDETNTFAPGGLAVGSSMAGYRIAGKLGSGGMGEVYRATDTKLQREVALKVLPPPFAHDTEWLSRFQREARALASLNHPHIAAIPYNLNPGLVTVAGVTYQPAVCPAGSCDPPSLGLNPIVSKIVFGASAVGTKTPSYGLNMFSNPAAVYSEFRPCVLGYDASCGGAYSLRGLRSGTSTCPS